MAARPCLGGVFPTPLLGEVRLKGGVQEAVAVADGQQQAVRDAPVQEAGQGAAGEQVGTAQCTVHHEVGDGWDNHAARDQDAGYPCGEPGEQSVGQPGEQSKGLFDDGNDGDNGSGCRLLLGVLIEKAHHLGGGIGPLRVRIRAAWTSP
jgi:hypothetical protein